MGALDATSKVPFQLWETEAPQHKRNKDVASDVCLSCIVRLGLVLINSYWEAILKFDVVGRTGIQFLWLDHSHNDDFKLTETKR